MNRLRFFALFLPMAAWVAYFLDARHPPQHPTLGDWGPVLVACIIGFGVFGVTYLHAAKTLAQVGAAAYYVFSFWLFGFAWAYWILGQSGFSEHLTRVDAAYFATTVATTTGFGDLKPASQLARSIVTVQMISGFVLVVFGIGIALSAVATARTNGDR